MLLQSSGDLTLVGLDIDDEDQGVVLLNLYHRSILIHSRHDKDIPYLLHGGFGIEWVDENLGGIHTRLMRDRLSWVLARARELEGLGSIKSLAYDKRKMKSIHIPAKASALPDCSLLVRVRLSSR